MNFSRQNISNYYLYDTQVENLFLSEYMASAPGEYVKAYMLASMYAQLNMPSDSRVLAKAMGCEAEKILEAWDYWENRGVIRKAFRGEEGSSDYDVEFVNLREEAFGRRAPRKESGAAPSLSDKALARLYRDVEAAAGRMLESREPEEIAVWLSEYRMSPEFVLCGYRFCAERRRSTRCRYVGAVLKDWLSKNISTPAQVESYLEGMDKHYDLYRKVFKELGFSRSATEEEKRIMNRWFDDFGFDTAKIFEACKKTAGISSPNINYVDAVLSAWYREEKGEDPQSSASSVSVAARIEKMYEEERAANAAKTEEMRSKIFSEIPRISAIADELRKSSFSVSRYMLMGEGGKAQLRRERAKMDALRQERASLLSRAGYAQDALEAVYTCGKCRDTGMLEDGGRCSCYGEKLRMLTQRKGDDGK